VTALVDLVRAHAEPLAIRADLDLVEVQVRGEGPRRVVKVIVDRKGGVDVERCTAVSRQLSDRLDDVDELEAGYVLEVTSPGIDHPLSDQRAFDRVEGRPVLVHRRGEDGRIDQIRGTVKAAEADAVVLDVNSEAVRVPYADIAKATQSLPW
jgi:ribosome maturation factor RimP